MKKIIFFTSFSFLFSILLNLSAANAQKIPQVAKNIADSTTTEKQTNTNNTQIDIDVLQSNALKELTDSTEKTLTEKKQDVSDAVLASQKALVEKESVQNKVEDVEKALKETQTKIKRTTQQQSKADIQQLKKKSQQLEKEHQALKKELETKKQKSKKAFEKTSRQQGEIEQLKNQLHQLEVEKNKRSSPRRKALLMGFFILSTLFILFIKDKLVNFVETILISRGQKGKARRSLRARTFLRIFSWSLSVLIIFITVFMILELFGFDSTTTLAGAGVFGVAIGFGAQQFIKDIFSGLFLVLEGQYGVNDFVTIGKHSGNVEDINLRFTKLRNYDGNIIYIANGDVQSVINHGKVYANSVINFYVDVNQDVDLVFTLIRDVIGELRVSPDLVNEILGDVELLGINAFTVTGIEIKFRIKTAPLSQWLVGREVRLALKQRFDNEGIQLYQLSSTGSESNSIYVRSMDKG